MAEFLNETIELFLVGNCWMSRSNDPKVRELLGTDTVPTAFMAAAPARVVLARIQRLNPDAIVRLI